MAVSVSNLQYRYRQHEPVILSIPSWQVETGQRVFLHGPSGSGKSTLLNLLAGIIPCQQGEVTIMNTALHQLSSAKRDRFRASHIGYVFQQFNLISYLNASENVELAARVSHQPAAEQRDQAISELLDSLHIPQHVRNKPASELSIGQQQRVAVARALIKKPQLLIVDEPTSALDSYNRDLLMRLLVEQSRLSGITLVFVSHDKQLMPYFDQVVSLADINQV